MTSQQWLVAMLGLTAFIYSVTAITYHISLRPGMCLVFVGYTLANLGLIMDVFQ